MPQNKCIQDLAKKALFTFQHKQNIPFFYSTSKNKGAFNLRSQNTCLVCTKIIKNENNIITGFTKEADCDCRIRKKCPDDGSSIDRRRQKLEKIPKIEIDEN